MLALRGGVPDAFRIEGVAAGGRSPFAGRAPPGWPVGYPSLQACYS